MATRTKKTADSREVENFPMDQVEINKEELQPRAALNPEAVTDYQDAYSDGDDMPALELVSDGETNWLVDGFHRIAALKKLGFLEVPKVNIRPGSKSDAIRAAIGANRNFGVRRTNADKRRAIELAFRLMAEEGKNWTDTAIAEMAGVSSMLVGNVRGSFEPSSNVAKPQEVRETASGSKIVVGSRGRKSATLGTKEPSTEAKPNKNGALGIHLDRLIHEMDKLGQAVELLMSVFPTPYLLGEAIGSNPNVAITFGKQRKRLAGFSELLNSVPIGYDVSEDAEGVASSTEVPAAREDTPKISRKRKNDDEIPVAPDPEAMAEAAD